MIQKFADWLIYSLIGLDAGTKIGSALNFFVYDSIKILLLLFLISAVMGVINAYFPIDRLRNFLNSHKLFGLQYVLASLFGAITPFCSCSSVPLFIGFVKGGIPLGVTFSFLITSPLVNEVTIAMFLGTFGAKTTLIYVLSGVLLGTIGENSGVRGPPLRGGLGRGFGLLPSSFMPGGAAGAYRRMLRVVRCSFQCPHVTAKEARRCLTCRRVSLSAS